MTNVNVVTCLLLLAMQLFYLPNSTKKSLSKAEIAIEIYLLDPQNVRCLDSSMAFFPNESDLPQSPLITNEEITSYQLKWDSASNDSVYILELKDAGIDKVSRLTDVSVRQGKPFALCVNRKPVFGGYFWSPFSSYSCDWIVIPLNSLNGGYSILGSYPLAKFLHQRSDPRSSKVLLAAFRERILPK